MSVTGIQNEINRIKQNIENAYSVYEAFGADIPSEKTSDNLVSTAGTMKPVLYSPQTLTEAQKEQVRNNIGASKTTVLGDNPTGGVANDTVNTWSNLGNGVAWISEQNQVIDQPSQYGFIINYIHETDIFQIFHDQTNGETYFRSGDNINNWFQNWRRVAITNGNDYINAAGVRASETITVGDDNSAMVIYTNGIGDRNSKLWIDACGEAYFTEVYARQKKLATEEYVNTAVEQLSNEKVVLYSEQTLTAEQKAQVRANIGAAEDTILELVDSIEECVDTSKRYVLPDGYVYAWTYGEHVVESKNHILSSIDNDGTPYNDGLGYKTGYRLNSSGEETTISSGSAAVSGFIPYNGETVELRIPTTVIYGAGCNYLHVYNSNFVVIKMDAAGTPIDGSYHTLQSWVNTYGATSVVEDTTIKISFPAEILAIAGVAYLRVSSQIATTSNVSYFDLALNEGIDDSEVVTDYSWQNTGLYYGSEDTGNRLDALENKVNDHEIRLTELESSSGSSSDSSNNVSSDIPDYWVSELEAKASAIQTAMEKAGRKKSAFLWYTDAHWVNGNSKMSPKILNYLYENTPMNKVNFGGDIIGDTLLATRDEMEYLYEWRKAIKGLPNHHSVFGNHDNFNLDTVDYEDENYRYAFLLAPEETNDMVMGDGNYYYMDNHAEKTRYLYFDYIASNQTAMMAQGQFMVDAMMGVPEGWHIVAIAHRWWQYSSSSTPTTGSIPNFEKDMLSVFDAYNAKTTRSGSNYFYAQDFTEAKGKVEFCIGGHIHVDYDFRSEGGIPIIITTADTNQNRVPDSTVDSGTTGTTTEAAVFGIIADYNDSTKTKITVVGVGRGTSRVINGDESDDTGNTEVIPVSLDDISYTGSLDVGATVNKSLFTFTVTYSDGTTKSITGASTVSPETMEEAVGGYCEITVSYTEGSTTVSGYYVNAVNNEPTSASWLEFNRDYTTGVSGTSMDASMLDHGIAYTNVAYGALTFNAKACTVADVSETGVTITEPGVGGIVVSYPVALPDISTQAYNLSFDYTGTGKTRVYYKYGKDDGTFSSNNVALDTSGSSHADIEIPAGGTDYKWLVLSFGANTGKTTTISNVSLTKAE